MDSKTKKSIITFLLLTLVISAPFYYLVSIAGKPEMVTAMMWGPGLAAIIVSLLYHRGENVLNFRRSSFKFTLAGLWMPLAYAAVSYGIYLLIYGKDVLVENVIMKQFMQSPVMLLLYLGMYFVTALGEEIGWSGYLTPKLVERFGFNKGSFLVGLVWITWHMPVFATGYMADIPLWYQLPVLTGFCITFSYLRSYIVVRSKSMWPGVILHLVHNFVLQIVLDQSMGGDLRHYLLSETGVLTVGAILMIAVICTITYRKKAKPIHTYMKNLA